MFGRRGWLHAVAAIVTFAAGLALGDRRSEADLPPASFHDMRVIQPGHFQTLVAPEVPAVAALAARLGSLEDAYLFVRDRIAFEPSFPVAAPDQILIDGRASCLGKATLLASLYRALGIPAASVRVVTGQVSLGGAPVDHAWVDLEYGSICLRLDPTDLLGRHEFLQFPNEEYLRSFVFRENFCFNDKGFAVVSQLNRLKGRHP
jgi:hypothetical protein